MIFENYRFKIIVCPVEDPSVELEVELEDSKENIMKNDYVSPSLATFVKYLEVSLEEDNTPQEVS